MTTPYKWYILSVQSGREEKAASFLKDSYFTTKRSGLNPEDFIQEYVVPKRYVPKYESGKKIDTEQSAFPGYIFIKMNATDEILAFIKEKTRQYSGYFIGSKGAIKPKPITDSEYEEMVGKLAKIKEEVKSDNFVAGQVVKIISGAYTTMRGIIKEVDQKTKNLTVTIVIFGQEMDIQIGVSEVERIKDEKPE